LAFAIFDIAFGRSAMGLPVAVGWAASEPASATLAQQRLPIPTSPERGGHDRSRVGIDTPFIVTRYRGTAPGCTQARRWAMAAGQAVIFRDHGGDLAAGHVAEASAGGRRGWRR
jgi:hypothetical protein